MSVTRYLRRFFKAFFLYTLISYSPLAAIRRGFVQILPLVIISAFAQIVLSLPFLALHNKGGTIGGIDWRSICVYVENGTFGIASLAFLISGCHAYFALIPSGSNPFRVNRSIATIICVSTYFILVLPAQGLTHLNLLSLNGGLPVILCVVAVCPPLFLLLYNLNPFKKFLASTSFESGFGDALTILPVAMIMFLLAAVLRFALSVHGISSPFIGAQKLFSFPFNESLPNFLTGLKYILFSHGSWFFGIHGSHMFSSLETTLFGPSLLANINAVKAGGQAVNILTDPFINCFVYTGGSGSSLALIGAILLKSRENFSKRISYIGLLPAFFNINEILLFGLPVVLNPVYFIPFLLAPILQFSVAYLATTLDIVPVIATNIHWTTPIFLSGYLATGSIAGILLQIVCLFIGIAVYLPFVRLSNTLHMSRLQIEMKTLSNAAALAAGIGQDGKRCIGLPGQAGYLAQVLAIELEQALDRKDQLLLAYQPQIDISKQQVSGAEALLRWYHPEFGQIPPHIAVAIAEDTGLIHRLGLYILRTACSYQAGLSSVVSNVPHMAVNFSAKQLEDTKILHKVTAILKETGVDPKMLKVEVTETIALSPGMSHVDVLKKMREMGLRVAIDDFGMGHTSLRYLQQFPVDYIKIDRSLTINMANKANVHIVQSIVRLCEAMNIQIIVEGVETAEQLERFKEYRCSIYQGYFFSKPLGEDAYKSFLQEPNLISYPGGGGESKRRK